MSSHVPDFPLVLIVGNDQPTRKRYADRAAAADLRVEQAHNGFQALEKAATLRPDIITTDLSLSCGLDGLELCRRLGRGAFTMSIPILAVAQGRTPTEVEAARAAGCASVLVKPCSPERLLVEILWVLARTFHDGPIGRTTALQQSRPVQLLTRALQTAVDENIELTRLNADVIESARLWADWYERTLQRANAADAELRRRRGRRTRSA